MKTPYDVPEKLARLAKRVRSQKMCRLPAFIAMTDPDRVPDPVKFAERLPEGSALIYRHFGASDRVETGLALAQICRTRSVLFLVSADAALADLVSADGIHWPESRLNDAINHINQNPLSLNTISAHSPEAARRADEHKFDGLIYSCVFDSQSPSASPPCGPQAIEDIAKQSQSPVFALGGITMDTAPQLVGSGLAGIVCVGSVNQD